MDTAPDLSGIPSFLEPTVELTYTERELRLVDLNATKVLTPIPLELSSRECQEVIFKAWVEMSTKKSRKRKRQEAFIRSVAIAVEYWEHTLKIKSFYGLKRHRE
jgi:hypothetical protein